MSKNEDTQKIVDQNIQKLFKNGTKFYKTCPIKVNLPAHEQALNAIKILKEAGCLDELYRPTKRLTEVVING